MGGDDSPGSSESGLFACSALDDPAKNLLGVSLRRCEEQGAHQARELLRRELINVLQEPVDGSFNLRRQLFELFGHLQELDPAGLLLTHSSKDSCCSSQLAGLLQPFSSQLGVLLFKLNQQAAPSS